MDSEAPRSKKNSGFRKCSAYCEKALASKFLFATARCIRAALLRPSAVFAHLNRRGFNNCNGGDVETHNGRPPVSVFNLGRRRSGTKDVLSDTNENRAAAAPQDQMMDVALELPAPLPAQPRAGAARLAR